MKIIILGAGRVGQSAAASLVSEHNDITVIDTDGARRGAGVFATDCCDLC